MQALAEIFWERGATARKAKLLPRFIAAKRAKRASCDEGCSILVSHSNS